MSKVANHAVLQSVCCIQLLTKRFSNCILKMSVVATEIFALLIHFVCTTEVDLFVINHVILLFDIFFHFPFLRVFLIRTLHICNVAANFQTIKSKTD
jgi:hypothetical protein